MRAVSLETAFAALEPDQRALGHRRRAALVAEGLKRVGLSPKEARYFTLHAVLDVKHSEDWNREAIRPAVAEDPRRATAMAEGALIRLKCGERCFEAYRAHLRG
jgi:hypothetical protein